jgi:hypothetical protein
LRLNPRRLWDNGDELMVTTWRVLLTSITSALLSVAVLCLTLRLDSSGLRLPLNYLRDANIFLARAKAIVEGNWVWWNPRIGMPFGSDWRDFPMNITLDSALMWVLSRFTQSPPLIVNLVWIIAIAATAGLACYAFVRLRFRLATSAACGVVFSLLPYVYFRGTNHLHSVYYAVPLVALAAIEIVRGTWTAGGRWHSAPAFAWIGCVIAGLAYAYTAFFAVFVLAAAGGFGFLRSRHPRSLMLAAALAGTVGITALVDLSPSLLYWARNGPNAAMLFKSPAEAELYALKIRFLVTPVPDHPIRAFRAAEAKLAAAKYPLLPNENEWGRLGTIGSIGFLGLIVFALGAAVSPRIAASGMAGLLGPSAALTLACVLFGTVGGFGDFFSTFVSPDIRCYARIFPFIGFFSITAAAVLFSPLERRLPPAFQIPALIAITVLAGYDQAVPSYANDHQQAVYQQDEGFVRWIETILPANSMVFELPYTDFPNEIHPAELLSNDLLRPYLHSSKYRWSWPAISGTTSAEWSRLVAALPVPEMLRAIAHRGFSGLWLDSAGFTPGTSPANVIATELRAQPQRSPDGRFLFYDLRGYVSALSAAETAVQVVFERGFYYEERGGGHVWRWSLRRGRITLVNPLDSARKVSVSMRIETADTRPHQLRVSWPAGSDQVQLPTTYHLILDLPPSRPVSLDLECACPSIQPAGSPRSLYFSVSDVDVRN